MKSDFLMNVAGSGVQQLDLCVYPTSETKTAVNLCVCLELLSTAENGSFHHTPPLPAFVRSST